MSWRAVDAGGNALGPARSTPALALAAAPVVTWPLSVVDGNMQLRFADALGPGGDRVAALLDGAGPLDVDALARRTPAGAVDLPLQRVDLTAGVEAAAGVDRAWLDVVDRRRAQVRQQVVDAGRSDELEAALHVALLLRSAGSDATEPARVASGARLWLLAGAVASALAGGPDPFGPWGHLVAAGWWPIGPTGGRLVLSRAA